MIDYKIKSVNITKQNIKEGREWETREFRIVATTDD